MSRLGGRAARRYVAGPQATDAARLCLEAESRGLASTAAYWNARHDSARAAASQSLALLDSLAGTDVDCYLSVKAPALGFSGELLGEIVSHARDAGRQVLLDSLAPADAARTIALVEGFGNEELGVTLPSRWRRSLRDVERVLGQGRRVRVVKGQWADPDADVDPDEGFLELVDALAGRVGRVAVATHDLPLAREALRRLKAQGTQAEHELLLGLPHVPVAGARTRIYVPFGRGFLPYAIRAAARRPRILVWAARDVLCG